MLRIIENIVNSLPSVVNISITASYIVLAIIIIRIVFRKAQKWILCALWAIVAIRLVFPFSIESRLSLVPSSETISVDYFTYEGEKLFEEAKVNLVSNPVYSAPVSVDLGVTVSGLQTKYLIFTIVWLLGGLLMLLYALISELRLRRKMNTATLLEKGVKQSERCDSPFVLGMIKPVIYLPYNLPDSDISYVISHERAHIRRKDNWWKPIGFIILSIYWFNPVIWLAYILLCRDIEAACDEKVIKGMEKEERQAYSKALLNCSLPGRFVAACPLAFGEVGVKNRIKSVMNYKKPAFWIVMACVLIGILLGVCFLTNPKKDEPVLKNDADDVSGYYSYEYSGFKDASLWQSFYIIINSDGTFNYCEGLLSSYIGNGTWTLDGTIITLRDIGMGERFFCFEVSDNALIFRKDLSDDFTYMRERIENGTRFEKTGEAPTSSFVPKVEYTDVEKYHALFETMCDITGDGTADKVTVELLYYDEEELEDPANSLNATEAYVRVYSGSSGYNEMIYESFGITQAHMGNATYYLTEYKGKKYLLTVSCEATQGDAAWSYSLFSVTEDGSEKIELTECDSWPVYVLDEDGNLTDVSSVSGEKVAAFETAVTPLISDDAILLISCDVNEEKAVFSTKEHVYSALEHFKNRHYVLE